MVNEFDCLYHVTNATTSNFKLSLSLADSGHANAQSRIYCKIFWPDEAIFFEPSTSLNFLIAI